MDELREKSKKKSKKLKEKKEENKQKKFEKELQYIKKKNIESWSSNSDLNEDEENEEEDEYWQEEESCEDMEESVNHGELSMQHSPTKNPEKQKKPFFFILLYIHMYSGSLKVSFPIIVSLYI